jgi:hypothetical protein
MKQTAVEWYEKEINSLFEKYEAKQISRADFLIMKHNIFYPAKEMEKEQKGYTEEQAKQIWKAGQEYWKTSGSSITFEELIETFKQQEQ